VAGSHLGFAKKSFRSFAMTRNLRQVQGCHRERSINCHRERSVAIYRQADGFTLSDIASDKTRLQETKQKNSSHTIFLKIKVRIKLS
jgi:hypothetical protein